MCQIELFHIYSLSRKRVHPLYFMHLIKLCKFRIQRSADKTRSKTQVNTDLTLKRIYKNILLEKTKHISIITVLSRVWSTITIKQ